MKLLKNYLSILSMLFVLSLLTLISCTQKEDLICKVSVEISEGGIGVASNNEVVSGEEVTLKAVPEDTYRFVNWTVGGKVVSKENPYTTIITATTQFKPNFEKDNYKVTVVATEGGTVKASKTQVGHNGEVTLTATTSNFYYEFVNWTVNGEEVSTKKQYTASITADTEFKANFKQNSYFPTGLENGKDLVDLGLSVKWATSNVGATTPDEYGDYFALGETEPKNYYIWSTYKYCNGSNDTMTKYCEDSDYGIVDNKTTLELKDDAAYVNWGGKWRMPTAEEIDELRDTNNCTWTWITQNGVAGYKVTSKKNGNSIFLPAAGYHFYITPGDAGIYGYYWSSSLYADASSGACNLDFGSNSVYGSSYYRFSGFSVRAVCE